MAGKAEEESRRPFRQHWALQNDGDLWQQFWRQVQARGPHSIRITKVKGHATEEMVRSGKVREEDKEGNDKADRAADLGVKLHREGAIEFSHWLSSRRKKYKRLMTEVYKVIAEVMEAFYEEKGKKILQKAWGS